MKKVGLVLKIIGAIFVVLILIAIFVPDTEKNNAANTTSSEDTTKTTTNTQNEQEASVDSYREKYDKVQVGMSKEELIELLGKPDSVTESTTEGIGTTELYSYDVKTDLDDIQSISITVVNNNVYDKTWIKM